MPAPPTSPQPNADAMQRRLAQLSQAMGEANPLEAPPFHHHARGPSRSAVAPEPLAGTAPPRPRRRAAWIWWSLGLFSLTGSGLALVQSDLTVSPPPQVEALQKPAASPASPAVVAAAREATPAADDAAVLHMLEQWRLDWSRQDVPAYLSHYSARFEAADGQPRSQWEAHRRKNLLNRSAIRVELSDLHLERADATHVRVRFLQSYLSGRYQETAQPKTLWLALEDGHWRIAGEWLGNGPTGAIPKP